MNIEKMKTRHSAETLTKLITSNPLVKLPSGDILLPPARLAFAHVAKPNKPKPPRTEGKFEANLLWPTTGLLKPLAEARLAMLAAKYPSNPTGVGMRDPFKDQAQMISPAEGGKNVKGKTYDGFVAGCPYISATGNRRPGTYRVPFVNGMPTPCVTEDEITKYFYSGAWVIATVNCYPSGATENPGVFFGLQSLLHVMDDNRFGGEGGSSGSPADYAGVNISSDVDPSSLF